MGLHIYMAPKLLVFLHSKKPTLPAAGIPARYLKADVIPSIASCHILLGEATKASASRLGFCGRLAVGSLAGDGWRRKCGIRGKNF